ncbi:MAG: hypothetical protein HPY76_01700 [Anaerolineae bacterium]|nr:hypothetical protein [Anaerolineae bacterium]
MKRYVHFKHHHASQSVIGMIVLAAALLLAACESQVTEQAFAPDPTATATATVEVVIEPSPMASMTPMPTLSACESSGVVVQGRSPAARGIASLDYRMYLPPCYDEARPGGYPLLVLLHGALYQDDQWDRLGVDETADRLILSGQAPPFLILMPTEPLSGARLLESDFDTWLVGGLLPYIDSTYAVCSYCACRAIGGLSRGAVWALRIGFVEWRSFGAVGGHSLLGDYPALPQWSHDFNGQGPLRLYLDSGSADPGIGDVRRVMNTLDILDIPYEWHLNPGNHDEAYWSAHVEEYLRWYSGGW